MSVVSKFQLLGGAFNQYFLTGGVDKRGSKNSVWCFGDVTEKSVVPHTCSKYATCSAVSLVVAGSYSQPILCGHAEFAQYQKKKKALARKTEAQNPM